MNIIVFIKDLIVSKRFIDCDDNLFNLIKNKMDKYREMYRQTLNITSSLIKESEIKEDDL